MENGRVKNSTASTSPDKEQPLIRSVISLKNKKRLREFEKVEDCFILDYDPYESSSKPPSPSQFADQDDDAPDFKVVAERGKCVLNNGQIALRDFPHSRHQCAQYPFSKTPHKTHCTLCHCYVCDVPVPCAEWSDHCHASHIRFSKWWYLRRKKRGQDSESDSNLGPGSESDLGSGSGSVSDLGSGSDSESDYAI